MEFEIVWKDAEINDQYQNCIAIVKGGSPSKAATGPAQSEQELVESFCLSTFFVVVSYDSIPIRSASVSVSLPHPLRSHREIFPKPVRLHYGFSITHPNQWSGTPQDAHFWCPSDDGFTFHADVDFAICEVDVLGLSFVFQLEDGSWVKNGYDEDFYVGGGERTVPCSVEIPFSIPSGMEISRGQMLSLYRTNPFWLQPLFGGDNLHSCMHETQFVLSALSEVQESCHGGQQGHKTRFLALLPIIDRTSGIRASIFGVREGCYAGIRLETGRCAPLRLTEVHHVRICIASFAEDPYDAVRCAIDISSNLIPSYSSRISKISSMKWMPLVSSKRKGVLNSLGYCTWDAYGHEVNEHAVGQTLQWLSTQGISMGYSIIDDGWQAGGGAGPNFEHLEGSGARTGRPTLSSFQANEKFSHSLRVLSQTSSVEIVAWVAIIGYWGGTSGLQCEANTFLTRGALASGLHQNGVEDPAFWEKDYEVIYPSTQAVERFFERYLVQSMAREQGVSGVKVDGQSILEILCNPKPCSAWQNVISRSSITETYRAAVTKAVERAFPDSIVINSMACGPETIFSSGTELSGGNICWRTSNDHAFPDVEESAESVSWHILCNAMTTVFLGEIFPIVDWDMFRASDRFAHIHAVARVLSGGPVYFSDSTPFEDPHREETKILLKALTAHDGRLLRCQNPGRPTSDCLFTDPRRKPKRLLKIFNQTSVLGLIGIFNLDPSEDEHEVSGWFKPADVESFARVQTDSEYISLVTGSINHSFRHRSRQHRHEVRLPSMSAALVHICPIFPVTTLIRFAVLGQPRLLNAGAAVGSISIRSFVSCSDTAEACSPRPTPFRKEVECTLLDYGETYFWLDEVSEQSLKSVTLLNGDEVGYESVQIDEIRMLKIEVPPLQPWGFRLYLTTGKE